MINPINAISVWRTFHFISLNIILAIVFSSFIYSASNPVSIDVSITTISNGSGTGAATTGDYDYVATVGSVLNISKTHLGPQGTTSWFKLKPGEPTDVVVITDAANTTASPSTGKLRCDKVGITTIQADVVLGGVHKSPLPEKKIMVIEPLNITINRRGSTGSQDLAVGGLETDPHIGDVKVSYGLPASNITIKICLINGGGGIVPSSEQWYIPGAVFKKSLLIMNGLSFEHGSTDPISVQVSGSGQLIGSLRSSNRIESTTIQATVCGLVFTKNVLFIPGTMQITAPDTIMMDQWAPYTIKSSIDSQGMDGHTVIICVESITPVVGDSMSAVLGSTEAESQPLIDWVDFNLPHSATASHVVNSTGEGNGTLRVHHMLSSYQLRAVDINVLQ